MNTSSGCHVFEVILLSCIEAEERVKASVCRRVRPVAETEVPSGN